tara:strand:+ start:429 stop:677 length:249 start_codon:yes stop_codon:yes gene_type:complete
MDVTLDGSLSQYLGYADQTRAYYTAAVSQYEHKMEVSGPNIFPNFSGLSQLSEPRYRTPSVSINNVAFPARSLHDRKIQPPG